MVQVLEHTWKKGVLMGGLGKRWRVCCSHLRLLSVTQMFWGDDCHDLAGGIPTELDTLWEPCMVHSYFTVRYLHVCLFCTFLFVWGKQRDVPSLLRCSLDLWKAAVFSDAPYMLTCHDLLRQCEILVIWTWRLFSGIRWEQGRVRPAVTKRKSYISIWKGGSKSSRDDRVKRNVLFLVGVKQFPE